MSKNSLKLLSLFAATYALGTLGHAQTTPPPAVAIDVGHAEVTLAASGGTATSTYQWRFNGVALTGATQATLAVAKVLPETAGVYSVDIVDGTATQTASTVLGVTTTAKITGEATEVGTDIVHPNTNVYDQVLLTGKAATITADAGQVTRLSFVDVDDDIVQVEFSGAGTLSIALDAFSGPAAPVNYNQPDVKYVKGNATIVITGADESTHVSVFSVGRLNAINQGLFRSDIGYGGTANLAALVIQSKDGKFGGIHAGNADFLAAKGLTGVYASGVEFTSPVVVGEITASDTATPVLQLGTATSVSVAGGDFFQLNAAPVQVSGMTELGFTNGVTSHGTRLAAQAIKGRLVEAGVDVTARAIVK